MSPKTTIDDLKDILNEYDCHNDVKFVLHAVKDGEDVIFERELSEPDMWFHIYPTLIKAKLNEWSQDLSFADPDDVLNTIKDI